MRLPLRSLLDAGLQHPGAVGSIQLQGSGSSPDAFVRVEGLGHAVRLDGQIVAINSSPIVALRPPATWWRFACPHCGRSCTLLYRLDEHPQPRRCRMCAGLKRRRSPPSIAALIRAEKALAASRAVPAERQPYERGRAWLRVGDVETWVRGTCACAFTSSPETGSGQNRLGSGRAIVFCSCPASGRGEVVAAFPTRANS